MKRFATLTAGLALLPASVLSAELAKVTWYPLSVFGGQHMASGPIVFEGAFSCPVWAMGAHVTILEVGIEGDCLDTGAPGYFNAWPFKVDIAAWSRPDWMDDDFYTVEIIR